LIFGTRIKNSHVLSLFWVFAHGASKNMFEQFPSHKNILITLDSISKFWRSPNKFRSLNQHINSKLFRKILQIRQFLVYTLDINIYKRYKMRYGMRRKVIKKGVKGQLLVFLTIFDFKSCISQKLSTLG